MHTASRDAYRRAVDALEQSLAGVDAAAADSASAELYGVAGVLDEHLNLRRYLTDASVSEEGRAELARTVFGSKVGSTALDAVTRLVRARLSTSGDLVEATGDLGRDAALVAAEKNGVLSEVEDELFRFGRVLDREPRLRSLLADTTVPADKRVGLLDSVLGDKVQPATHRMLAETVRRPGTRPLDRAAEVLADVTAARQDRSVAKVTTPVVLGAEQERRLTDALSRIYGRRISVHADVDPDVVGGMVVRVGGEVIDGSIAARLRGATESSPR